MPRLLPVAAAAAALTLAGAVAVLPASGQPESPTPTASAEASLSPTASADPQTPSPTPLPPSPSQTTQPAEWTPPPGYTGVFKPLAWVQIAGTGSCLNVRATAGLFDETPDGTKDVPVMNCLPDGFLGQLTFSAGWGWSPYETIPVQDDGHWWWYLLGQGWVAEDWLTLLPDESPYGTRPELSATGLIAFTRPDGVWVAAADGSASRPLYAMPAQATIGVVRWSPDGGSLAADFNVYGSGVWSATTRIIGLDGLVITEFPGLVEPNWSPDGARLSALRAVSGRDLGGYKASPVIVDLVTGTETAAGTEGYHHTAPAWSPDSGSVAYTCRSNSWEEYIPDGTIVNKSHLCAGDGLVVYELAAGAYRLLAAYQEDVFFSMPSWSPDGGSISVYMTSGSCDGYALLSAASGEVLACFSLPVASEIGGACGGSAESGASDWSPDGRLLAYHWQFRTGQNGVALVDVITGERRLIQTTGASSVSFAGNGQHLTFGASGYVWTADVDGSDIFRLADGQGPAWQPVP
jgi:hypothetical protein